MTSLPNTVYENNQFAQYAGQLVQNGIETGKPSSNLEEGLTAQAALANMAKINGLIPKIGKIIIRDTMVATNPLEPIITNYDMPFGQFVEEAAFDTYAPNKKNDGVCHPVGYPTMASQLYTQNFNTNITVSVKDREVNRAVFGPEEVERYVAQKMRTQLKTYEQIKRSAWIQLISDVIDGTRSIGSMTKSNEYDYSDVPAGTESDYQSYAPTAISGYAGKVYVGGDDFSQSGAISMPTEGSLVETTSADTLEFLTFIEGLAADMQEESASFNKLGINNFIADRPAIVMDKKTLNAMDFALNGAVATAAQGWTNAPARDKIRQYADLIEIGSFADLPTNDSYEDMRVGAVVIDKGACMNFQNYYSVEANRCVQKRETSWNLQAENVFAISRAMPSAAILFDTSGSE